MNTDAARQAAAMMTPRVATWHSRPMTQRERESGAAGSLKHPPVSPAPDEPPESRVFAMVSAAHCSEEGADGPLEVHKEAGSSLR